MSTLLREVLDIPEQAGAEDYVLRLTDSIEPDAIARTVDEYVVTPALAEAFDAALGLVAEALTSGVSRGAFLAGSFGSGKSHFMASCTRCCGTTRRPGPRPELQPVIARHDDVLLDKNVLPLAFHLHRRGVAGAGAVPRVHPADRAGCTRGAAARAARVRRDPAGRRAAAAAGRGRAVLRRAERRAPPAVAAAVTRGRG